VQTLKRRGGAAPPRAKASSPAEKVLQSGKGWLLLGRCRGHGSFRAKKASMRVARRRLDGSERDHPPPFATISAIDGAPVPSIVPAGMACRAGAGERAALTPPSRPSTIPPRPPALAGRCGHAFPRSHGPAEHKVKGQWLTNRYGKARHDGSRRSRRRGVRAMSGSAPPILAKVPIIGYTERPKLRLDRGDANAAQREGDRLGPVGASWRCRRA
jgi:hypothetical protein